MLHIARLFFLTLGVHMSLFFSIINGGSAPGVTVYGGEDWDTTNLLSSAIGGGYRGNVNGFTVAVVCKINTQVNGGYILDYIDPVGRGYSISQPSPTEIKFSTGVLAENDYTHSAAYLPAADLGKVQVLIGVHTGLAGQVFLWANDMLVGGGVDTTGYSLPDLSLRQTVGVRGNGTAAHTGVVIYGWGGWDRALTNEEIHQIYDEVRDNGKLPTTLVDTVMINNVAPNVPMGSTVFPSTIPDEVGSEDFTFVAGSSAGINLAVDPFPMFTWVKGDLDPLDVVVGFGDSLMEGKGAIMDAPAGYPPGDNLQMFKALNPGWVTLVDPTGSNPSLDSVSVLGLYGWLRQQQTGLLTGVINTGIGSRTTSDFLPVTSYYNTSKGLIQVGLSRRQSTLRAFITFIGPNDAAFTTPTIWDTNRTATLNSLRAKIGSFAATTPEVVIQLAPTVPTDTAYPEWANVRTDIVTYAERTPNSVFATGVDGPWVEVYKLHPDTAASYALAQQALPLEDAFSTIFYGGYHWDLTNKLASVAGGGYRGNPAGFTVVVVCKINEAVDSGHLLDYIDPSGKGYRIFQSLSTEIRFQTGVLAGNDYTVSPPYTIADDDLGKVQVFVGVHTGLSGEVQLWANNRLVGLPTATTGYTLPSLSLHLAIGHRQDTSGAHTGAAIYAWGGWDRALTTSEIHQIYASVRATGKLPTGITDTVMINNVSDDAVSPNFPSVVTDQVGSEDFSFIAGSAAGIQLTENNYGNFTETVVPQPFDVWFAFGDTQTVGQGANSAAPMGYPPGDNTLYMVKTNPLGWEVLVEPTSGVAPMTQGTGIVGLFGWESQKVTNRTTGIINAGLQGGTSTDWLPGGSAYLYGLAALQIGLSQPGAVFRGFITYSGRNDAIAAVTAGTFASNWSTTIAAYQAVIGAAATGTPALLVQLPVTIPNDQPHPSWNIVRADIASLASTDVLVITEEEGPWNTGFNAFLTTPANYIVAQRALTAAMGHSSWVP